MLRKKKIIKNLLCYVLLGVIFIGAVPTVYGLPFEYELLYIQSQFKDKEYEDQSTQLKWIPYRLYVPEDYDESYAYPLATYIHGNGSHGNDNRSTLTEMCIQISLLDEGKDEKFPCIILVPQIPVNQFWVDNYYGEISAGAEITMNLIDSICESYSVDLRRLYISGPCTGAAGTWDMLFRYPKKFAAGVIVAGIGPPAFAPVIKEMPLWVYNSTADPAAPIDQARAMVNALKDAGSKVIYTEYEGYDHIRTSETAYWDPDLYPWLFSQINLNAPYPEGKRPIEEKPKKTESEELESEKLESEESSSEQNIQSEDQGYSDPRVPIKADSLRIVLILAAVMVCAGVLFLLFYKKILYKSIKSLSKDEKKVPDDQKKADQEKSD